MGAALIYRRPMQAERHQPRRLPRRNPHGNHQRPPAKPDRRPHALAIPKDVKPESLGDWRGAYQPDKETPLATVAWRAPRRVSTELWNVPPNPAQHAADIDHRRSSRSACPALPTGQH